MLARFARWEKCLLAGVTLLLMVLPAYFFWPGQKFLADRLSEADRGTLTNRIDQTGAAFVGDELRHVIHALRTSKRVLPWHKVAATGGFQFQFFKGAKPIASVNADPGIFWVRGTTYLHKSSSLDPLFERLGSENPPQ